MMIRTAGGPGLSAPIDFGERRKPLPRSTWAAIGIVALAHIGVGAALYYQRFEMPPAIPAPATPPVIVTFDLPRPKPPEPALSDKPPAPTPPLHATPTPATTAEPFEAAVVDAPATDSTVLTLTRPVPEPPVIDAAPAADPRPPSVIANPQWISRPSGEQLMRAYPGRAMAAEVAGSATLSCSVRSDGRVSDCAVAAETPAGYGFGRAAQGLSRHFRISPRTIDGRAVEGSRVNVAIRFTLPED